MFDMQHPFFLPVWRRYAVTAFCLLWALVEIVTGSPFWAILFGALGIYCVKALLLDFDEAAARARAEAEAKKKTP